MDLSILLDPNLVYLVLVTGIWLAVTAAYMPGTGIVELLAAAMVIGGLLLLASMPTNWLAALLVLIGGILFLVLPFLDERYSALSLGGLALQVVGSLFLFNGMTVAPLLILTVGVLSLAYYRFVLIPVLRTHRQSAALRSDRPIIGEYGRVQSVLNPTGTVRVQGESWSARLSENALTPVPVDASVVVVDQEGLVLIVTPEEPKRKVEPVSEE